MDTSSEETDRDAALRFQMPGRGPGYWFGVGGGLGLLKPAPGTWGSLLGLPIGWVLSLWPLRLDAATWDGVAGLLMWLALLGIAWASCRPTCEVLGSKDPGQFVADEFVALAGIYLFVPFTLTTALLGFALFRLFDIWKPWPVSLFDRMGGTQGVMLDDVVAAAYALAVIAVVLAILP